MTVVVVVCAVGVGLGLIGILVAVDLTGTLRSWTAGAGAGRRRRDRAAPGPGPRVVRVVVPLAAAVAVGVVTRWPVAAVLGALGAAWLPKAARALSPDASTRRAEAVATWTEQLRDTLTASAGLAEAIIATVDIAPPDLRGPVGDLVERLATGVPVEDGLRVFAAELDQPEAEDVVRALQLAATSPAQRLTELLGALAQANREVVAMRLRVEASRTSARSGVRIVMYFSLGFAAVLAVAARSYLAPLGTPVGQLVLLAVGGCYAAGLFLMVRLVRPPSPRPVSHAGASL